MIRRPPRSTLFPTRRSSDLVIVPEDARRGDALRAKFVPAGAAFQAIGKAALAQLLKVRSEEHTSELQSRQYLVCRLLLEKKKKNLSYPISLIIDTFTVIFYL